MEVVVIGARGLLGQDVVKEGARRGWQLHTPSREELDVTDAPGVAAYVQRISPIWIVNCAAYVAVDDAENERDLAFKLNVDGALAVARAADRCGSRVIHISTDYVFDGNKKTPYLETDTVHPLGVYAESKLEGERAVLSAAESAIIARTAWLYGAGRPNFPSKIWDAALQGGPLRLVSDRIGSPTYTADLAVSITEIIEKNIACGIYHVVNEGEASWYDLCKEMLHTAGIDVDVRPASNADYPTPAKRPMYSVLSTDKIRAAGIGPLPHWRDAVHRFVDELRLKEKSIRE